MYKLSPRFITSTKINEGKIYLIDIETDKDQFIELDGDLVKIFTDLTKGQAIENVMKEYPEDQRQEINKFVEDMVGLGILTKKV